jgi:hypothetical protein
MQTVLQKFLIKIKGTAMYKMNCSFKQTKHAATVHHARSFVRLLPHSSSPPI